MVEGGGAEILLLSLLAGKEEGGLEGRGIGVGEPCRKLGGLLPMGDSSPSDLRVMSLMRSSAVRWFFAGCP